MKNKLLVLLISIIGSGFITAQVSGKIIIRNASDSYPKFIASLNGVRIDNTYNSQVTFAYLDDNVFRLRVLQYGIEKPLTFAVNNEANYVTKYIITKDEAGYFKIVLESKALMTGEETKPVVPSTPTVAIPSTPTVAAPQNTFVNQGPVKVSDKEYAGILAAIKKEPFENTKLDLANNFFSTQYLSSAQVLGVIKQFSFENNKLSFAKFAYSRTVDKQNFYKVYDGLSFNGSKKELSDFVKKNP